MSEKDELTPLEKLKKDLELPVKLSETEKEKFNNLFDGLKMWLDDTREAVLEKDRDEAYRYLRLLVLGVMNVDADYIAGVTVDMEDGRIVPSIESESEVEPESVESPEPIVRPTREEIDGWLAHLKPEMKIKASELLDCFRQYLDPESEVGTDVICTFCSPAKIERCIRDADPSITDSSTIFMDFQQKGPQ